MNKRELERRAYSFEVRADEDGNIITGRPIVYNSRTNIGGMFDEVIARGALDETDLTDVRFLVNHDTSRIPLARSRRNNGSSTMQLTVDSEGLAIRVQLDTENNAEAAALYSAVRRGDISGMSFMYSVRSDEWTDLDTDHPTRTITSIESVVEVSAVTFPAYEDTEIEARDKAALESARSAVETARRSGERSLESDLELVKAKTLIIAGGY